MTRTPSCFHFASCSTSTVVMWSPKSVELRSQGARSPLPSRSAGETFRFLRGSKQRFCLIDALLLLSFRIGIGDNAGASLNVHHPTLDQRGAQSNTAVELAGGGEIAHRSGIYTALFFFQLVDDFHCAHFGCA